MAVISAPPTEGVIGLGEQLQHQFEGRHPQSEQHGVVPVIGVQIILGLQSASDRNLYGFMPVGTGVDILGSELGVLFI